MQDSGAIDVPNDGELRNQTKQIPYALILCVLADDIFLRAMGFRLKTPPVRQMKCCFSALPCSKSAPWFEGCGASLMGIGDLGHITAGELTLQSISDHEIEKH